MGCEDVRDIRHWQVEGYKQRITVKQWRKLLLDGGDTLIANGRLRTLKSKSLGSGIVEIFKGGN